MSAGTTIAYHTGTILAYAAVALLFAGIAAWVYMVVLIVKAIF